MLVIKAYGGVEVQLHSLWTLVLDASECLTSRPGHVTPVEEPQYRLNGRLGGHQNTEIRKRGEGAS